MCEDNVERYKNLIVLNNLFSLICSHFMKTIDLSISEISQMICILQYSCSSIEQFNDLDYHYYSIEKLYPY